MYQGNCSLYPGKVWLNMKTSSKRCDNKHRGLISRPVFGGVHMTEALSHGLSLLLFIFIYSEMVLWIRTSQTSVILLYVALLFALFFICFWNIPQNTRYLTFSSCTRSPFVLSGNVQSLPSLLHLLAMGESCPVHLILKHKVCVTWLSLGTKHQWCLL